MSTRKVRNLIVGGGVSGLCAALFLGEDTLVLEREREPGGYCRSIRRDGFVWDWAGHFFHFRTDWGRDLFLSLFDEAEVLEAGKNCRVLYRGRLIGYPFQTHLQELDKEELIDCLYDLFHRPESAAADSFLAMLYGAYGRSITDKFLRPYNEKLYACDLRTLSPAAMGRFFPAADPLSIIGSLKRETDGSYNRRFFYPKGGAGLLVERLSQRLPPETLLTGRSLVSLDPIKKEAVDSEGEGYCYERLINTAPLPRFLCLLGEKGKRMAAGLSANKVLVLNLGFEGPPSVRGLHWLYVPGPEAGYYRVGFYDSLQGGGRASMYVEIACPADAKIEKDAVLREALSALRGQGLIQPDNRLLASCALVMDPAYVHIKPDTEEQVRRIKAVLAEADLYSIGRYGGWRYCSTEDCMREAAALAESFLGRDGA